jgi:hypothetical protein
MKLILTMMIAIIASACAVDMGRQGEIYNTKSVFEKHERHSGGSAQ